MLVPGIGSYFDALQMTLSVSKDRKYKLSLLPAILNAFITVQSIHLYIKSEINFQ